MVAGRLFAWVVLGVACSGRSEATATTSSDGSSTAGTGGAAATDGGGRGGNGAGGSGGTAAGRGGTGTTGTDAARDATDDSDVGDSGALCPPDGSNAIATAYCKAIAALPCGAGLVLSECVTHLEGGIVEANARGCGCELLALLACATERGLICPGSGFDDVRVDPSCAAVEDRSQRCLGDDDNCMHGSVVGSQTCSVACDQYAAECSRSSTGWSCTCSYGPELGVTFTTPTCDDANVAVVCR